MCVWEGCIDGLFAKRRMANKQLIYDYLLFDLLNFARIYIDYFKAQFRQRTEIAGTLLL